MFMVGDVGPGGGIVFSVTNGGTSGLEVGAVTNDLGELVPAVSPSRLAWGCFDVNADGFDNFTDNGEVAFGPFNEIPSGLISSGAITSNGCFSPALQAATDFGAGWYLPSTIELTVLLSSGILELGTYWSSTEDNNKSAFAVLGNGVPTNTDKNEPRLVVPVRQFKL